MLDIAKIAAQFTPGATGVWFIAAMFFVYMAREWNATRKLSADDRLARREGYVKQVESLALENRALRADLTSLRSEYDVYRHLCQAEAEGLWHDIVRLEFDLAVYKRKCDTCSIYAAKGVPE